MNTTRVRVVAFAVCAVVSSIGLSAQWLRYRDPRLPRNADGTPNLRAPAPKAADGHPDLSGIWRAERSLFFDLAGNMSVEMTPWAAALQRQRSAREHVDDPSGYCALPGLVRLVGSTPFKIVQTSSPAASRTEAGSIQAWRGRAAMRCVSPRSGAVSTLGTCNSR